MNAYRSLFGSGEGARPLSTREEFQHGAHEERQVISKSPSQTGIYRL